MPLTLTLRSHATGSHAAMVTRSGNHVISAEIVVETTPIPVGKTSCPAYQGTCQGCGKLNHFEAVCRSKGKGNSRNKRCSTVNKVSEDEPSDEGEVYTFSLITKTLKDQPLFKIKVHDMPVTIMADSGASINILDEKVYPGYPTVPSLNQVVCKFTATSQMFPLAAWEN